MTIDGDAAHTEAQTLEAQTLVAQTLVARTFREAGYVTFHGLDQSLL